MSEMESGPESQAAPAGSALRVRLFVAGDSPSSRRARRTVESLLGERAAGNAEFEIVDVLREPERALESNLLATPTLIIERGDVTSRYVGDFYEQEDLACELTAPSKEN
jgi:circadian clock protein KaiB